MRTILLIFLCLDCFVFRTAAQQPSDLPANSAPYNLSGMQLAAFDNRYEGVKGFYTFLENFVPGEVTLKKEQVYAQVPINYDAVSDNLLLMSEKLGTPMLVRKDLVQGFVLKANDQEYYFEKRALKDSPVFLIKMADGKFQFYCKVSKHVKEADFRGPYKDASARFDEFITTYAYYHFQEDGTFSEITGNKKAVLKFFPQHTDALDDFFKKNRVDFKNLSQVRALFEFINTLDRG